MSKKNSHSDTRKLYVTESIHDEGYFVRTDKEKFAWFNLVNGYWVVWFYKYKYRRVFTTLTEALNIIERIYRTYWRETYGQDNN